MTLLDPMSTARTMLRRVHVQNFKSIADLTLEPGLVNVLIGENGCGKSNFLEALAFASAAEADKLDNEFLTSRGIRVTEPEFMRSAFKDEPWEGISFDVTHDGGYRLELEVFSEVDSHYPRWIIHKQQHTDDSSRNSSQRVTPDDVNALIRILKESPHKTEAEYDSEKLRTAAWRVLSGFEYFKNQENAPRFTPFLIYSPENSALRTFVQEGQVLPLGIKGEGLFKLLRFLATDEERWEELKSNLRMIDWFRDLKIAPEQAPFEQTLQIHDRFVAKELVHFDQRSANEGFLFLLFYISLMISPDTPSIFAIDNIDASLNPKTATALTSRLAKLAKKYNKQIFLTTHSPAVLDGLDLTDPEHRLFVFQRNRKGETRCRRVTAPQPVAGETP
ncbi:AAA family ATPase [Cystobacter fuscus]